MMNVVDPFTRTTGIAGKAYIDMHTRILSLIVLKTLNHQNTYIR